MLLQYYQDELIKHINNNDYKTAFEYIMRLIPNLSIDELTQLSNYFINLWYLQNYYKEKEINNTKFRSKL